MRTLLAQRSSLQFQDRDHSVLRGLFESRMMTAAHIAALYFDGKKEATKKRLQKLKAAGFIGERRRRAYEPSLLALTRKAFEFLKDEGVLSEYPRFDLASLIKRGRVSELTIRHELEVMDVKTAFHSAITKTREFSVAEFTTWPLLCEFEAFRPGYDVSELLVRPDGFIRIHEKESDGGLSEHTFFLEVDRSTETQDRLITRAGCYLDYYKSGRFAERNGAPRSEYKSFPFRVLMVFNTPERRNNTAERLLQHNPPLLSQVCLTTFAEVKMNPLGLVWIRPIDYRDATTGTQFEPQRKRKDLGYKRHSPREMFIERRVRKFRVLSD